MRLRSGIGQAYEDNRSQAARHRIRGLVGPKPSKPYPREEAVQLELESVAFTDPLFKTKRVSEFMDNSIIAELDRQGFSPN
jgi:hypothetical protein